MALDSDIAIDRATGALDERFWRGLERGILSIPACSTCGRWVWPARPLCPTCCAATLSWTEVRPVGHIYSWTRTWYPFVSERTEDLPYVVAVVELDDAPGVRVLGVFDNPHTDPDIGASVTGYVAPPNVQTLGLPSLRWTSTA